LMKARPRARAARADRAARMCFMASAIELIVPGGLPVTAWAIIVAAPGRRRPAERSPASRTMDVKRRAAWEGGGSLAR